MRLPFAAAALLLVSLHAAPAGATSFLIPMDGLQVVDPATGQPGAGHPTATAIATLRLDAEADSADWSFSVPLDLLPITAAGIYRDTGGQADPLVVAFVGLVGEDLIDPDVDAVLVAPTLYYLQLATGSYPQGAVRGQLPEPGTLGLLGTALAGMLALRRRAGAA